MKDWKGNDIKAGDTLVFVRTTPMFKNFGWMIPNGEGKLEFYKSETQPPEHCWDCQEMATKEFEGQLYYGSEKKEGNTIWMVLDEFTRKFFTQPGEILCIKGVSDSEEEYYKEFFKVDSKLN